MEVNIARPIDISSVAKWLQTTSDFVECVLLLDCRPFIAFNEGRIMTSCNVHCPPILKRRSGGFVALENIVPNMEKRQMLENGKFTKIIVYDTDTVDLALAAKDSNLYSVLKSLRQQVEHCDPYYIQGTRQTYHYILYMLYICVCFIIYILIIGYEKTLVSEIISCISRRFI